MTDEERARAIALCSNGMTPGACSKLLGVTRNTVIGVVYRARMAGVIAPQAPALDRDPRYNLSREPAEQLCFADECHAAATHGKFCDSHRYRPRLDQPLSRLMGARA